MQPAQPRVFQSRARRFRTVGTSEVRNTGLLGMPYHQVLSRHDVVSVYIDWSGMPPLADQYTRMQKIRSEAVQLVRQVVGARCLSQ